MLQQSFSPAPKRKGTCVSSSWVEIVPECYSIQPLVFNLLGSEEFTPTKSRKIWGFELSNKISWRNRSNKNTLRERYPASRQRYHLCLFLSNFLRTRWDMVSLGVCSGCEMVRIHGVNTTIIYQIKYSINETYQLVMAFGNISTSWSSVTDSGLRPVTTAAQLSECPCVTLRLNSEKSEYRFHTPTVLRKLPSQKMTRNWAYLPSFLDWWDEMVEYGREGACSSVRLVSRRSVEETVICNFTRQGKQIYYCQSFLTSTTR